MEPALDERAEWLEADGLGGFASGTVGGLRTRRYHALLLAARSPPTERVVLVNGFDAWVETGAGRFAISEQRYAPGITHPLREARLQRFATEPWPTWLFLLPDGTRVEQRLVVPKGSAAVALAWRSVDGVPARLTVRPFLSGRDYHALQRENDALRLDPERDRRWLHWRTYEGLPAIRALTNGAYIHQPYWYRNFLYEEERARGLDHLEDLASPGEWSWDLAAEQAVLILTAEGQQEESSETEDAVALADSFFRAERARRGAFPSRLQRSADAYLVRRGRGATIVAGYPWFTDWGRDTFIALRGCCLATGRWSEARAILLEWAGAVSEGMLPNRFPDRGQAPEYNSVDAALWYVVAAHEYLQGTARQGRAAGEDVRVLSAACLDILDGYSRGTRHGIRGDSDGLLACGEPGVQLTWMDARIGEQVITPRIGKPVEVQALWLNALRIGAGFDARWSETLQRGEATFVSRFWNEERGSLYDVVDVDHRRGTVDPTFRANQVLAVGGLPFALLAGPRAVRMVGELERRLWTPLGLRSLAPEEPAYRGRYEGGVYERDSAYHQGTVWPWLAGPFVEAWLRVNQGRLGAYAEAKARFLDPLLAHLDQAGLDHVSEIADGDPPHTPRGCPFQAWSVGELLRALALVAGAP